MESAKLTSKGRITIPKAVRDALGVRAGDRVRFLIRDDGVVEMVPRIRDLLWLAGILKPSVGGVTIDDMDRANQEVVAADFERPVE